MNSTSSQDTSTSAKMAITKPLVVTSYTPNASGNGTITFKGGFSGNNSDCWELYAWVDQNSDDSSSHTGHPKIKSCVKSGETTITVDDVSYHASGAYLHVVLVKGSVVYHHVIPIN